MTSSEVLFELRELKVAWKKQNFVFSEGQQIRYDNLLQKRRDFVKSWYKDGLVYKKQTSKQYIRLNKEDETISGVYKRGL